MPCNRSKRKRIHSFHKYRNGRACWITSVKRQSLTVKAVKRKEFLFWEIKDRKEVFSLRELISKLSKGQIEYDLPETEVSVTAIEESVGAGTVWRSSFEVFGNRDEEIKGLVYSTNEYLKVLNRQFVGRNNRIELELDTSVLEPKDVINGRINIVSNGGELFIPFHFEIQPEGLASGIGTISNMFHFLNLIKQEYDEALKLFFHEDFERIILKDSIEDRCMYRGLIKSTGRRRALEEFVIAVNKKQKVAFSLSDTLREYDSLSTSYGDMIRLSRSSWGLLSIEVSVEGDFITDFKEIITDEDFAGNHYEFNYLIDVDRLHDGMNYGRIIFQTIDDRQECVICVDNVKEHDIIHNEVEKCLINVNQKYLAFRMRKCSLDKWAEETLRYIDRARGFDDSNPYLRLIEAQVYISKRSEDQAGWLIDSVAEEVMAKKERDIPLYCYYLYVKALQKRELEYTLMVMDTIRKYYENGYDKWQLLWMLLYIDPAFENNKSLKLARIKEQYKLGCHSTLMYYEALYVLNKQPVLLRMLNNFELQVFNFGSKYGAIDLRLASQIADLALHEKVFRPVLFRILVRLYEKFENKVILNAIISVLIRSNKTQEKYFKWYALGVRAELPVTRLYEYYVMAMPEDFSEEIPNTVLMYYVYNGDLLGSKRAFFYARIIGDQHKHPNVYKNYLADIEHFALEMLRRGKIDRHLSVIYDQILTPQLLTGENVTMLPKLLNTWEITLSNDRIKEVIVLHKEMATEDIYGISDGKAFVSIYTDDAILMFRDFEGNIYYKTIEYKMERLINNRVLNDLAVVENPDNVYILAKECEQSLKYHKNLQNGVAVFTNIMAEERIRTDYKDSIFNEVTEVFLEHYDGDELDEYLRGIAIKKLSRRSRIPVVELMIMRGLYEEVTKVLEEFGTYGIDEKKILKLCTYYVRENAGVPQDTVTQYCDVAFKRGKYNEASLVYLNRYFNGTVKEMLELWRISKEYGVAERDLEERLIAQMLFSRAGLSSICQVYDSYYTKGAMKMLKGAYLFYEAYISFVQQMPIDSLYYKHLEDELMLEEPVFEVCRCAYLLYHSDKPTLREGTKRLCLESIAILEKQEILFDFFKRFERWFSLSGKVLDKTTVEYRCEPRDKVLISYYVETGTLNRKEYLREEMKQVFKGMYIKSFTLFYGEKINYYITEITDGETVVTESSEHLLDDRSVDTNFSRYGRLNDILVCRDLKEETIVSSLAEEYYICNEMVKQLFG